MTLPPSGRRGDRGPVILLRVGARVDPGKKRLS